MGAAVVAGPVGAIRAAIAIPAYNDYTIRAEATAGLVGAASAMQRAVDEFAGAHDRCHGNDDFAPLLKQFAAVEKATTVQFGELADRKSTRLNSSHYCASRMPSAACKKKQQYKTP